MPDAPRWSVNEIAYLRESAMIGFIEGYTISNIVWDPQYNRWLYLVSIKHRGTEPTTVIDMHNLRTTETLELGENNLISQPEAIDLAIIHTEERLNYLKSIRAAL